MYIEVRKTVQRRHDPVIVPVSDIPPGYNFRSVYVYNEATKNYIEQKRSTKGLQGIYVYSFVLFVDVDGDSDEVQAVGDKLCDLGIGFEYWTTGNRGGHFHVRIEPMEGPFVPQSQAKWVTDNLSVHTQTLNGHKTNRVDTSIYRANGQIRLPGAIHQKTSGVKTLQETIEGKALHIDMVTAPVLRTYGAIRKASKSTYIHNLTRYKPRGKRHLHTMIIVKEGIALNKSLDQIIEDCRWWNIYFTEEPLDDIILVDHVIKTYRDHAGAVYET
jgi:hypothetical protein